MVVPKLRPWRAARPHVVRAAGAVRPRIARWTRATAPRPARTARTRTWQYTAGAATAGLALAAGVATAAGPWDATGQRTAERDRAVALEATGGADHGRGSGGSGTAAGAPRPAPSAATVLTGLDGAGPPGRAPRPAALADVLSPLLKDPALGSEHAASVVDLGTGRRLFGTGVGVPLTPASTTKIATAVAALTALGPDHRLTTRTALEPDTGELVLVGGGDPTLTARADAEGLASLRTLADRTAAALKKRDLREVTLSYDTTLYAGDEKHPIGVNGNLAEVTALMADEARTDDSTSGPVARVPDPAADAARTFAGLLADRGITATPPAPPRPRTGPERSPRSRRRRCPPWSSGC